MSDATTRSNNFCTGIHEPHHTLPMILHFKVADAYYRVSFQDTHYDGRQYLSSSRPFYIKNYDGEVMFDVCVQDNLISTEAEGKEIGQFDCGGSIHGVFRTERGYKFLLRDVDGEIACAFESTPDFSQSQVSLYGTEVKREYGLNNALMIIFAFAGAYHNILLIHSSVTMFAGKGYMFLGVSGTGKSTHSQLWLKYFEGTELLNDDNPVIRIVDGEAWVYGSPWSGKTPCYRNLKVRIGALVQLRQSPENTIRRERPLAAFSYIFSSCSTMIWDKPSYDAICNTVTSVVQTTPIYFLDCRADEEAARLSHSTIVR